MGSQVACLVCGQPDNIGECSHTRLTAEEWARLGEDPANWPDPRDDDLAPAPDDDDLRWASQDLGDAATPDLISEVAWRRAAVRQAERQALSEAERTGEDGVVYTFEDDPD